MRRGEDETMETHPDDDREVRVPSIRPRDARRDRDTVASGDFEDPRGVIGGAVVGVERVRQEYHAIPFPLDKFHHLLDLADLIRYIPAPQSEPYDRRMRRPRAVVGREEPDRIGHERALHADAMEDPLAPLVTDTHVRPPPMKEGTKGFSISFGDADPHGEPHDPAKKEPSDAYPQEPLGEEPRKGLSRLVVVDEATAADDDDRRASDGFYHPDTVSDICPRGTADVHGKIRHILDTIVRREE